MPIPEIEVLLPVHNEAASIEATIREIYAQVSREASVGFIICEDGSKDNTKEVLTRLAGELPLRLNLSDSRRGYSGAVSDGLAMLESEYVLCLDSDGQCDPKDFPPFWAAKAASQIIKGRRIHRRDTMARRRFSGLFYVLYQMIFRVPIQDPSFCYILIHRTVVARLAPETGLMRNGYWWEFIARAHRRGYPIHELPVNHRDRHAGGSRLFKWNQMPRIFVTHLAALPRIWWQTR